MTTTGAVPLSEDVRRWLTESMPSAAATGPFRRLTAQEVRREFAGLRGRGGGSRHVLAEIADVRIPVAAGASVRGRIYRPREDRPGTIVYFHGGGWFVGDIDTHDHIARALAAVTGRAVVSIDYRRAPEHPFPTPFADCAAGVRWAATASGHGLSGPLAVAGDSAGANLAAAVALHVRDHDLGGRRIALAAQLLAYPAVDLTLATSARSLRAFGEGYGLTRYEVVFLRDQYVPRPDDRTDPRASPLHAGDLSGLPPAIVATAGYDPILDDGVAYAERLREAGNRVSHLHFGGQAHAFLDLMGHVASATAAGHRLFAALRRRLDERPA